MSLNSPDAPVPLWLWRLARAGLAALLVGTAGLALALGLGLADPPRAGPLLWQDDFKGDTSRWAWSVSSGAALAPRAGALVADLSGPEQMVFAVTPAPAADYTLEVAGAQTEGAAGAAYGLVLNWHDDAHYTAVVVNGNGYAEAYQQAGTQRRALFPWQQWPHLLAGTDSNRVRVDVRGSRVSVRVNDERLCEFEAAPGGQVGVIARGAPRDGLAAPARVVFSWVRVWAAP